MDETSTQDTRTPRFPELPLVGFGFLTHFVWEMFQVPWFAGMAEAPHSSVVWLCTRATGGDVMILLVCYWFSSVICGHRQWLINGDRKPAVTLVITGVAITIFFEWLATGPLDRWEYADSMPITPVIGVGLAPLLQWLMLPPLILWLTRRHMLGVTAVRSGILTERVVKGGGKNMPLTPAHSAPIRRGGRHLDEECTGSDP